MTDKEGNIRDQFFACAMKNGTPEFHDKLKFLEICALEDLKYIQKLEAENIELKSKLKEQGGLEAENKELRDTLEMCRMTLLQHGFTTDSSTLKEIDKLLKI